MPLRICRIPRCVIWGLGAFRRCVALAATKDLGRQNQPQYARSRARHRSEPKRKRSVRDGEHHEPEPSEDAGRESGFGLAPERWDECDGERNRSRREHQVLSTQEVFIIAMSEKLQAYYQVE
jgi:hypothetical protein